MKPGSGPSVVKEKSSVGCFASDCSSDSPQAEESGTVGSLHCDAFRDITNGFSISKLLQKAKEFVFMLIV